MKIQEKWVCKCKSGFAVSIKQRHNNNFETDENIVVGSSKEGNLNIEHEHKIGGSPMFWSHQKGQIKRTSRCGSDDL